MMYPVSDSDGIARATARSSRIASAIVSGAIVLTTLLVVGAAGLWAYYGTAVFFELIKTGIAACM